MDSFIVQIKSKDVYVDLPEDVETRFDTSHHKVEIPLPIEKNKKAIEQMNDELDGRIMKEFVALNPKMYSFLTNDGHFDKKKEGVEKCLSKPKIKLTKH